MHNIALQTCVCVRVRWHIRVFGNVDLPRKAVVTIVMIQNTPEEQFKGLGETANLVTLCQISGRLNGPFHFYDWFGV